MEPPERIHSCEVSNITNSHIIDGFEYASIDNTPIDGEGTGDECGAQRSWMVPEGWEIVPSYVTVHFPQACPFGSDCILTQNAYLYGNEAQCGTIETTNDNKLQYIAA